MMGFCPRKPSSLRGEGAPMKSGRVRGPGPAPGEFIPPERKFPGYQSPPSIISPSPPGRGIKGEGARFSARTVENIQ